MYQKSWPYWLKGGLIAGIIGFFIGLILTLSIMRSSGFLYGLGGEFNPLHFNPLFIMMFIFVGIPITGIFFGMGSLIGWRIDIKKAKKNE